MAACLLLLCPHALSCNRLLPQSIQFSPITYKAWNFSKIAFGTLECVYIYINLNKLSIFPDVFSINTCDFPAKYATCGRIKQFFYLPPQSGAKTASIQTSGRKDLGLDHLIPKEESCAYVLCIYTHTHIYIYNMTLYIPSKPIYIYIQIQCIIVIISKCSCPISSQCWQVDASGTIPCRIVWDRIAH